MKKGNVSFGVDLNQRCSTFVQMQPTQLFIVTLSLIFQQAEIVFLPHVTLPNPTKRKLSMC